MKKLLNPPSLHSYAASVLLTLSLVSMPSIAHEYSVGAIEVVHPYAPPTPPGVAMAAGYLEIVNHGDQDDRLIGGEVYFAQELQIHQTVIENDVSRMRELKQGLVIPAGSTVKIEPMGIHLMFAKLAEPLIAGEGQSATLLFEKAGELEIEFAIVHSGSSAMDVMHKEGMTMDSLEMDGKQMDHTR